jgi:hypothetical protein
MHLYTKNRKNIINRINFLNLKNKINKKKTIEA